jgi:dGTPase
MWTERRSGHEFQRGAQDHRSPYERDRTRVIHCPAFRRLQRKTQILGTGEGDFHRTRLTHSLEVASIGHSLVRNLMASLPDPKLKEILPSDDLIQTICLLHDIGHPPFGHGGEVALNFMMRQYGGFEGNAQTLRLLAKVEESYGQFGLDLTRRALLGILKYPVSWSRVVSLKEHEGISPHHKPIRINDWLPPKAYFDSEQPEIDWILSSLTLADKALFQSLAVSPDSHQHGSSAYYSLDCSIMDIADDIAYGVHDLEDAIHLRLMSRNQLDTTEFRHLLAETPFSHADKLLDELFDTSIHVRKQAVGEMVNYFITAAILDVVHDGFEEKVLRYNLKLRPVAEKVLAYLKQCVYQHVIDSQESRTFEHGGQTVVLRLFEAFSANPTHLLDKDDRLRYLNQPDETRAHRVICDYIANMTDEYAYRMHERLFGMNTRTFFERL